MFVYKLKIEHRSRIVLVETRFNGCQGFPSAFVRVDLEDDGVLSILGHVPERRTDRAVRRLDQQVFDHADDGIGFAFPFQDAADRVLESDEFHSRFVEDESGRIRREFTGKIPALHDLPAYGLAEFGRNAAVGKVDREVGVLPFPVEAAVGIPHFGRRAGRFRHLGDDAGRFELIPEGFKMGMKLLGHAGHDQAVARVPDGTVLGVLDLPEYDDGAGDQGDGNRELQHHQRLAQYAGKPAYPEGAFQHFDGLKRRQEQSRVAAGKQAGDNGKGNAHQPEPRVVPGQSDPLVGHMVEKRQDRHDQQKGNRKGEEGDHQRFGKKLGDQLFAHRPDGFADADLLGSFFGTCGAQVHEIDASEQEHKNADNAEKPDRLDPAADVDAVLEFGIQMPFAHGMQENDRLVTFIKILHLVHLDVPDLFRHGFHIRIVGDLHEGLGKIAAPRVLHFVDPFVGDQVELPGHDIGQVPERGVEGQVLVHPGHPHGGGIVDLQDFVQRVFVVEEGFGHGFGEQDRVRVLEPVPGTGQHLQREHIGRLRFEIAARFEQFLVAVGQGMIEIPGRLQHVLEIAAVIIPDLGAHHGRVGHLRPDLPVVGLVLHDLGDAVVVLVVGVVGHFVPDPEPDQNGYGHSGSEACNIDEGGDLALAQISEGDFQIIE